MKATELELPAINLGEYLAQFRASVRRQLQKDSSLTSTWITWVRDCEQHRANARQILTKFYPAFSEHFFFFKQTDSILNNTYKEWLCHFIDIENESLLEIILTQQLEKSRAVLQWGIDEKLQDRASVDINPALLEQYRYDLQAQLNMLRFMIQKQHEFDHYRYSDTCLDKLAEYCLAMQQALTTLSMTRASKTTAVSVAAETKALTFLSEPLLPGMMLTVSDIRIYLKLWNGNTSTILVSPDMSCAELHTRIGALMDSDGTLDSLLIRTESAGDATLETTGYRLMWNGQVIEPGQDMQIGKMGITNESTVDITLKQLRHHAPQQWQQLTGRRFEARTRAPFGASFWALLEYGLQQGGKESKASKPILTDKIFEAVLAFEALGSLNQPTPRELGCYKEILKNNMPYTINQLGRMLRLINDKTLLQHLENLKSIEWLNFSRLLANNAPAFIALITKAKEWNRDNVFQKIVQVEPSSLDAVVLGIKKFEALAITAAVDSFYHPIQLFMPSQVSTLISFINTQSSSSRRFLFVSIAGVLYGGHVGCFLSLVATAEALGLMASQAFATLNCIINARVGIRDIKYTEETQQALFSVLDYARSIKLITENSGIEVLKSILTNPDVLHKKILAIQQQLIHTGLLVLQADSNPQYAVNVKFLQELALANQSVSKLKNAFSVILALSNLKEIKGITQQQIKIAEETFPAVASDLDVNALVNAIAQLPVTPQGSPHDHAFKLSMLDILVRAPFAADELFKRSGFFKCWSRALDEGRAIIGKHVELESSHVIIATLFMSLSINGNFEIWCDNHIQDAAAYILSRIIHGYHMEQKIAFMQGTGWVPPRLAEQPTSVQSDTAPEAVPTPNFWKMQGFDSRLVNHIFTFLFNPPDSKTGAKSKAAVPPWPRPQPHELLRPLRTPRLWATVGTSEPAVSQAQALAPNCSSSSTSSSSSMRLGGGQDG